MFEVLKGGKKKTVEEMSVLEKLQENARLKKEVAAIEKELDKTQKLSYLLELALQAKENGEEGFWIPEELEYMKEDFEKLLEEGVHES